MTAGARLAGEQCEQGYEGLPARDTNPGFFRWGTSTPKRPSRNVIAVLLLSSAGLGTPHKDRAQVEEVQKATLKKRIRLGDHLGIQCGDCKPSMST